MIARLSNRCLRPGLYPETIRHDAWKLITRYLVQRRSQEIVEAIFRARWPRVELQIFIRQIALFELQEWYVVHVGIERQHQ